jgi:PAS domain S-box-containing protein
MKDKTSRKLLDLSSSLFSDADRQRHYLQLILAAIPVGVVVVDELLTIQAFNPAAERITGVSAQEALGQPYSQVLQTHKRDIADPLEEALETGQSFVNQRFYLRSDVPDVDVLPIRHSASVLTDEEGRVIGGVTIFADISRQVALEQQIRRQRRYLRDVLRSVPDGVVTTNHELVIKSWNEAAAEMTGRPSPEVVGQPCAEVLGAKVAAALQERLEACQDETLDMDDEIIIRDQRDTLMTKDGQSIPISFNVAGIEDSRNEHVRGGIIAFRDVSEVVTRQRKLNQQRRYLQEVLETAPYGIFTVDREGVVRTFNQAAEALTGFARSFVVGKPYQETIKLKPLSDPDPLPALLAQGGEPASARLKLTDAGGKTCPVRYTAAPLTDVDEQLTGGIVVFQDIGDIVAAERTQKEFISMVSHELRTPLTSVKGFVTAVLDGRAGEINDKQRHYLSVSREQSDLLLDLINDLLDLSRLDTGEMDLDRNHVSVPDLVERATEAITPQARRKELTITTEVAPDLPRLWADENKLLRVLQNLLSNAVKFTPLGGEIRLCADRQGESIELSVTDTGIGIALEDQEQIFERFYQVENVQTRQVGGTGLGLPIVKGIVEAHGGRVEVQSEVGAGSTFRVSLPLSPTASPVIRKRPRPVAETKRQEKTQPVVSAKTASSKPQRLNPLVMTVDDNPAITELIQLALEEEGYDVVTVSNGPEALQVAAEKQPDLITLDILMPEMDGFQVLDLLKQDPTTADIPVCIVSIVEDKVKGYRMGAIDYVSKPFESEQLLGAVSTALAPGTKHDEAQILLVEDDPHAVELVELALSDQPYELFVAGDGVVGLEMLHRLVPDLVVLDIMIPKIDGYAFIRQAKAKRRTSNIPIIVLSVRTLEEDISRALRLGAEQYLTKTPGVEQDLSQVIQEVLDNDD